MRGPLRKGYRGYEGSCRDFGFPILFRLFFGEFLSCGSSYIDVCCGPPISGKSNGAVSQQNCRYPLAGIAPQCSKNVSRPSRAPLLHKHFLGT